MTPSVAGTTLDGNVFPGGKMLNDLFIAGLYDEDVPRVIKLQTLRLRELHA